MPTLDEEFEKKFVRDWRLDFEGGYSELTDWFKSYLRESMESVKLEYHGEFEGANPRNKDWDTGYNQALSDQEAKIAQALRERGI